MTTLTKKQLNRDLIQALEELIKKKKEPILIDLDGQKFVVLSERDYRGWLETAYLFSSSKNAKILREAMEEPIDQCKDLKDVLKELDS